MAELIVKITTKNNEEVIYFVPVTEDQNNDEWVKTFMDDEASGDDVDSSCSYTIEGVQ